MKTQTLYDLQFIPSFLGQPMYPGGFPVKPEQCNYEGKSAQELFFQPVDVPGKVAKLLTEDEAEFLRQYLIYYIHAPIWMSYPMDAIERVRADSFKLKADHDEISLFIINELLDLGIDPF